MTPEALRSAPVSASLQGGILLSATAEAWRSFQPLAGTGDSLIVLVRVAGDRLLPEDLLVTGLHVLRGDDVWESVGAEEHPREPQATAIELVARGGPSWAPGDSIDVVVSLRRRREGPLLLRAPRIAIARVD